MITITTTATKSDWLMTRTTRTRQNVGRVVLYYVCRGDNEYTTTTTIRNHRQKATAAGRVRRPLAAGRAPIDLAGGGAAAVGFCGRGPNTARPIGPSGRRRAARPSARGPAPSSRREPFAPSALPSSPARRRRYLFVSPTRASKNGTTATRNQ